ncbi:hypothetical protein F5884DRAFT_395258 [Xylogone sp. PMI_703]|nr:hypothetical protein F5884DRAFT_395258 [Xylogone sp. PMI_703]
MKSLTALLLIVVPVLVRAQTQQLLLSWDDLQISNDNECGSVTLTENDEYNGVSVSASFVGDVTILNTTVTDFCNPGRDSNLPSPFGFATSAPNVAAVGSGFSLELQIASDSERFVGSVNFSISVQLNETDLQSNGTIIINTLATDFGNISRSEFDFIPFRDGPGPYQITVQSPQPYILFEVSALLLEAPNGPVHNLGFFTDSFVFEVASVTEISSGRI